MSVFGSVPVTLALADRPSEKFTWTVPPAPTSATTWLLVTMYPLASKMTPDPSPVRLRMSTTLGFTAAAMSASEERSITFTAVGPLLAAVVDVVPVCESAECTTNPPTTPPPPASSRASRPVVAIRAPRRGRVGAGCDGYPWGGVFSSTCGMP